MKLVYLLIFMTVMPALAHSEVARVVVKDGYNLRSKPKGKVLRTTRESVSAVILKKSGLWRQVCFSAEESACRKAPKYWVFHTGIEESKMSNEGKSESVASSAPEGSGTAAATCKNCNSSKAKGIDEQMAALDKTVPNDPLRGFELPRGFAPACKTFINKKGLGEWGHAVVNAARTIAPNCFYNKNLFGRLCPNYNSLTRRLPEHHKDVMVALVFAAIAQTESTCRAHAQAPGVNDIADGMFQLEYSADQRRRAGRNRQHCATNRSVNTQSQQFQAECAVSIVEDTVCSWQSYLFDPSGYWQKLRGRGEIARRIQATAKLWGLCE